MRIDLCNDVYIWLPDQNDNLSRHEYVLQVIAPQPEGQIGGSDTHVIQLAQEQMMACAFIPIILFKRNHFYEKMLLARNIPYICGISAKNDIEIADALSLWEGINRIRIIHSHQYDANFLTCTIKDRVSALKSVPTVMTCHGWIENTDFDIEYTRRDFESYHYADALIAVCNKDKARLDRDTRFSRQIKECIHNGVILPDNIPTHSSDSSLRHTLRIGKTTKIIAYVGRLAAEKRVDYILECARMLYAQQKDIAVIIAGEGPEKERLVKMRDELSLQDCVFFTGFIPDPSIVYDSAYFCALFSDTEGTPRFILESMARGKMVLATEVGGVGEIIQTETNGVLVKKGDVDSMVEKARYLLSHPSVVEKLNTAARNTIISGFSIREMAKRISSVYDIISVAKREGEE